MEKKNSIEFCVYGRHALFSDPLTRVGGEKYSYPIPTYQAIKGILESIYWKPTFIWKVDAVRIMNKIMTQSAGIRPINYRGGNDLSIYTYLSDVRYNVRAHFEWNMNRPDLAGDRNENKHYFIAKRMLERGGRRDIFLGTRECQGYVEPCGFDEGQGFYDDYPEIQFGVMFHSFSYPDENGSDELKIRLNIPVMVNGRIYFTAPEDCNIIRTVKTQKPREFIQGVNFEQCDPLADELGYVEEHL